MMNQYYWSLEDPVMDFIAHHGILGQKWGVRRFQDKSGRLTAEGRDRLKYAYLKNVSKAKTALGLTGNKTKANQNKLDKATAKNGKIAAIIEAVKNMSMITSNQNENFQNLTRLFQQQMDNFQNQVNYATMQHINTTNMMAMNSIQTAMSMSMY